jgi:hypothetical protein
MRLRVGKQTLSIAMRHVKLWQHHRFGLHKRKREGRQLGVNPDRLLVLPGTAAVRAAGAEDIRDCTSITEYQNISHYEICE